MRLFDYMECQSLSYRIGIQDYGTLWEEFPKGHWDAVKDGHRFFYPQTDGQSERTIQVLEEHLLLVEFAYNNSYQKSIQMTPYEALYGRPCQSPICWTEVGKSFIIGPDLIRDISKKVGLI